MAVRRPGDTVEEIYRKLRERIIDGRYLPGVRMSQAALAEELSVSRTPLREALHRLERDGLVVAEPNRGMVVAPTTPEQVEEYYTIRLLIEPVILAELVDSVTEAEVAKMAIELDLMESAGGTRISDFQEAHLRFHDLMINRYPPVIAELVHSLHLKIYRHQRIYFSRPDASEDYTAVDRMMLGAFADRDKATLRQLFEFHLIDAAVGLVLERSPDHIFSSILFAARGAGIELGGGLSCAALHRPVRIDWTRPGHQVMASLHTANLTYDPGR